MACGNLHNEYHRSNGRVWNLYRIARNTWRFHHQWHVIMVVAKSKIELRGPKYEVTIESNHNYYVVNSLFVFSILYTSPSYVYQPTPSSTTVPTDHKLQTPLDLHLTLH